jgi:hypothetical protein
MGHLGWIEEGTTERRLLAVRLRDSGERGRWGVYLKTARGKLMKHTCVQECRRRACVRACVRACWKLCASNIEYPRRVHRTDDKATMQCGVGMLDDWLHRRLRALYALPRGRVLV